MSEHTELADSLNNAIAYSWVLGWYAGKKGAVTDSGKILATEDIKAKHPDIVRVCNSHEDLLTACGRVRSWLNEEHKEELSKAECEQILFTAIVKATI